MNRLLWALAFCAATMPAQTATSADAWKPLRFLVGSWEAKTKGGSAGAQGAGTYSFQLELKGHVLARHGSTSSCQGPDNFDCEHGDLLYVYPDAPGRPFRAIYFDNEGHVIAYEVTTPTPESAVFLSSGPGPQYRLSYELRSGILYGKFEMRLPGQDAFRSYLEWSGARK